MSFNENISNKPILSVVIASYNSAENIVGCLASLENQSTDKDFEIIVVDSSTDGSAKLVEEKFPGVKLYRFSTRKFCGDARNFGISIAEGEIVAFIDADCIADEDWVNEILKAHKALYPAIGGSIANGNPESYVGWASYFCEFSQWMPNSHDKWLKDIAGANMSYKRNVFEKYGDFIEGTYCSDTDFHWRMWENGHPLRFVSSIHIHHCNIENLIRFLRHEYEHGLAFARVRIKSRSFSKLRRFVYSLLFPLIALKLFVKIGIINFKNRIYLSHLLKVLPLFTVGLIAWSLGEGVGYLTGIKEEKHLIEKGGDHASRFAL